MSDYATSLSAVVANSNAGITARNAFVPLAIGKMLESADEFGPDDVLADLCRAAGIKPNKGGNYRATMLHKGSGAYTAFTNLKTIWDNREYALPYVMAYGRYVPAQMVDNMNDELAIACGDVIAASQQAQHELSDAVEALASYDGDNALTVSKLKSDISKAKAAATRAENACAARVREFADAYIAAVHDIPAIPASVNAMVTIVTKAKSKAKAAADEQAADEQAAENAAVGNAILMADASQETAIGELSGWINANGGDAMAVIFKLAKDCAANLDAAGIEANADALASLGDIINGIFASRADASADKATGTNG